MHVCINYILVHSVVLCIPPEGMQLLSVTHGYYTVCVVVHTYVRTYAGPQLVIFVSEMYTHYISEWKLKCMCRSVSKSFGE